MIQLKISRNLIEPLLNLIYSVKEKTFNISTQYKFLKLKELLLPELEIYKEQMKNVFQFFKKDENGEYIQHDGGYEIKDGETETCQKFINNLNNLEIQISDIYFSLDELENLNLKLEELELLMPFIK